MGGVHRNRVSIRSAVVADLNVLSAANMIDAFQSALRFAMVADDAVIYHHVKELVSIRSKGVIHEGYFSMKRHQ